eukprot:SAG31_NODE_29_length_32663_cov_14.779695_17_plen_71_part_00
MKITTKYKRHKKVDNDQIGFHEWHKSQSSKEMFIDRKLSLVLKSEVFFKMCKVNDVVSGYLLAHIHCQQS